jgi:hypothetical protein
MVILHSHLQTQTCRMAHEECATWIAGKHQRSFGLTTINGKKPPATVHYIHQENSHEVSRDKT